MYGDPGPGTLGEALLQVLELLDVEDDVESQDGAGQGGGPGVVVVPGHVGVEGETISIPRTEVNFKVAEENNNYHGLEVKDDLIKLTSYSSNSFL